MRRAFITGGTGFIARHLAARLVSDGWTVSSGVRRPAFTAGSAIDLGPSPWSVDRLAAALSQAAPDVVFHMAGKLHANSWAELYDANLLLAVRLFEAVERLEQRPSVVLAGSAAEYGPVSPEALPVRESKPCHPVTDYGISKHAQTLMGLARDRAGLRVLVARIFNPVGTGMPRQLALPNFAHQIKAMPEEGGTLAVGNLDVARDFIDVGEAARLIVALASQPDAYGDVYNICSGQAYSLRPLVVALARLSGRRVEFVVDPSRIRVGDTPLFYGSPERIGKRGLTVGLPDFGKLLPHLLANTEADSVQR